MSERREEMRRRGCEKEETYSSPFSLFIPENK
jgi:hypothetical protein